MDTTSSDPNPIDLFIKYGGVIAALAYGFGFLEENEFLGRIGIPADFSFTDPKYFTVGLFLLVISMAPTVVFVACYGWLRALLLAERRPEGQFNRYTWVRCFVFTFGSVFAFARMGYNAPIGDALWASTAGAAASGMAIFEIRRMRMRSRPGLWEQVYPLLVIAVCLVSFAEFAAKIHWQHVIARQGQKQVRLLVEGDAVRGLQEMGLTFPELRSGDKSAELSGAVEVVFEGERTYALRVNGQVVRLGRGKVLGSVP